MKSRGPDVAAERQRAAEIEWLVKAARTEWVARSDGAGFDPVPALVRPELETQIKEILYRPELVPLLRIIERHNSQSREIPGRRLPRKDHFLLGPHLRGVLMSVKARNEQRQRLPVLDRPAAEVRDHLREVSASCKDMAELIRTGPQPHVALASKTSANEAVKVLAPLTELFEASDGLERQVVAFAELMDRAASWFEALSGRVQRAKENRHTCKGALRMRASEFLVDVFKRSLGRPYHPHVATIATLVSDIKTDADFVKKVEARQSHTHKER
jgi:hypothetical protein